MPSSGWVEGYPGVGESAEGGSNQFLYQHARNFDWGMTSAVGIENRRWTVKFQYEMSFGKESKNDNIGVNYNSLTEGGNLAASKIRNLECPNYEICLIDYGCGKFNRKIHIMEQYP